MPDILHRLSIRAPAERVFEAITTPPGLDAWWTLESRGEPVPHSEYELDFGPGSHWRAKVTRTRANEGFELEMTYAAPDWIGTLVGFELTREGDATHLFVSHSGWTDAGEQFAVTSTRWALYLRLLRRYLELGEVVSFVDRGNA